MASGWKVEYDLLRRHAGDVVIENLLVGCDGAGVVGMLDWGSYGDEFALRWMDGGPTMPSTLAETYAEYDEREDEVGIF
ncbi:hypothetical protein J1614_009249 [Plenodomus biglobosus]|nr:hypothetical protein J1614_009249 [Plenodomus biglobosus]